MTAPFLAGYAATKHALEAVAECLKTELEPFGIKVATASPGAYGTCLNDRGADSMRWYDPARTFTRPESLAGPADFLAHQLDPRSSADVVRGHGAVGQRQVPQRPSAGGGGRSRGGSRLNVRIEPPGPRAMTFKPTVRAAEPARELRWLGHLYIPGLADGVRFFAGIVLILSTTIIGDAHESGSQTPVMSAPATARCAFPPQHTGIRAGAWPCPGV